MGEASGGGQAARRTEMPALLSLLGSQHHGTVEDPESYLPPGRRDTSGFWYPARYREPRELFTAYQRVLQEKQRTVHRRRRQKGESASPQPIDTTVPLPAPQRESPDEA